MVKVRKGTMVYYPELGMLAVPIRKVIGSILLKQMYNLDVETFYARSFENPYYQYFCSETYLQYMEPYDPSDYVHIGICIGEEDTQKILKFSINLLRSREINEKESLIDHQFKKKI